MTSENPTYQEILIELNRVKVENELLKKQVENCRNNGSFIDSAPIHLQMFYILMDNLPDKIYFKDKESRFLYVNKSMLKTFGGINLESIVGKTDFDFFSQEHAQQAFFDEQNIIETKVPLLNVVEKETWPDRPETWVSTSKIPFTNAEGDIIGTFGLSRDITEQVRAEYALKQLNNELEQLIKVRTLELTESESNFRLLAETTSDIVFRLDENFNFSYCSPSIKKVLGYESICIIGTSFFKLIEPENLDFAKETIHKILSKNTAQQFVIKAVNSQYEKIWIEINASNIDENNIFKGFIGIARDVDSRVKMQEQNSQLIRAIENSPVSIVIVNSKGLLEYVNPRFTQLTGYTYDEAIGQNPRILKSGKMRPEVYKELWDTLIYKGEWKGEMLNKKKSGELYWEYAYLSTIKTLDEKDVYYIGVKEDITERKLSEENRIKTNLRLKAIIDLQELSTKVKSEILEIALEEAIKITESKIGYIYFYNEDTQEFTLNSWSNDVMKECSIADPDRSYMLEKTGIWGEAVRQRKPVLINDFAEQNPLKKGYPEGHAHLSRFLTIPIFSNSKIIAVVGVANKDDNYTETDILQLTLLMDSVWKILQKKQLETEIQEKNTALSELNAQKDKFFSIIAHDLKSPFNAFKGLTDILIQNYSQLNSPEVLNYIIMLKEGADNLYMLLENLLEWSRSLNEKVDFNPQVIDLNKIVCALKNLYSGIAAEKSIEIINNVASPFPIYADEYMLHTILRNLITNSLKFCNQGGKVSISAGNQNDKTHIIITDNGVGMNEITINNLFLINKISSTPGTKGEKGTGLGLLICKEFISKHSGDIVVESTPGLGSKFTIVLPFKSS